MTGNFRIKLAVPIILIGVATSIYFFQTNKGVSTIHIENRSENEINTTVDNARLLAETVISELNERVIETPKPEIGQLKGTVQ